MKLTTLLIVNILLLSFTSIDAAQPPQPKHQRQYKHIEHKSQAHTYRQKYIPDQDEKGFTQHSESYNPKKRIKKTIERKQVLRKVKKPKSHARINNHTAQTVSYQPDKIFEEGKQRRIKKQQEEHERDQLKAEKANRLLVQQPFEPERKDTCRFACGRDIADFEEKEKFTNKTEYEYVQAFIQGLNLVSRMPTASECTFAIIYFNDDRVDTINNITIELEYRTLEEFRPVYPVMRVLELFGSNFADAFPFCYGTFAEFVDYFNDLYVGANNDFNQFLISYLFIQMGYALTYRRIITKIDENVANQQFDGNYAQYGQIINQLILSLSTKPLEGLDMDVYLQDQDAEEVSFNNLTVYPHIDEEVACNDDEIEDLSNDDIFVGSKADTCHKQAQFRKQSTKELWKPKLSNYITMDKAWNSMQSHIPAEFFQNPLGLPFADKVAAMIFISCGLGIAYIFELQRAGVQLIPTKEINSAMESFDIFEPLKTLEQTSLNIQSLLQNGSSELKQMRDPYERQDKVFEMVLDVVDQLELGPDLEDIKLSYKNNYLIKELLDTGAALILDEVLLPSYGMPRVAESQRIDDWRDVTNFLAGLKDGTVALTGEDSKLSYCNSNVSDTTNILYGNWQPILFNGQINRRERFGSVFLNETMTSLFQYAGDFFRWPFLSVYNCYWATNDLIYRYETMQVPLLGNEIREDGTYEESSFWGNVLFNFAFNAGYQFRDFQWFYYLDKDEGATDEDPNRSQVQYWYRLGFVLGDVYMRLFFRLQIDAPEKLKTQVQV